MWCPFNPGHRLPEKSLEKHLINCQWRAEGYNKFDIALSESTLPPDAPSSIKIGTIIFLNSYLNFEIKLSLIILLQKIKYM